LIRIEKRVEGFIILADQRTHIVIEQAMKTYVTKSQLGMSPPQMQPPIGTQRQHSASAPYGMFPGMPKRNRSCGKVAFEFGSHNVIFREMSWFFSVLRRFLRTISANANHLGKSTLYRFFLRLLSSEKFLTLKTQVEKHARK